MVAKLSISLWRYLWMDWTGKAQILQVLQVAFCFHSQGWVWREDCPEVEPPDWLNHQWPRGRALQDPERQRPTRRDLRAVRQSVKQMSYFRFRTKNLYFFVLSQDATSHVSTIKVCSMHYDSSEQCGNKIFN